jgi:hypothetical protein
MPEKLFSLEEAQALLPRVKPIVAELQLAYAKMRAAALQVGAMVEHVGEAKVDTPENPDRAKYWALVHEAREGEERVQHLVDELAFLGAEIKDFEQGLLDFRTRRDGQTVYLCWKAGEDRIAFWHPLEVGFAGRKPVAELRGADRDARP